MTVLVVAEHDNSNLKTFSLNAINAASKIDSDVHVLVAGNKCEIVCKAAGDVTLVKKVCLEYKNKLIIAFLLFAIVGLFLI